ncbi:hypothetical protein IIB97_00305 [Patescibacteria group bacterium]|nr:hypothetical protein [Patescibacteria group bacterium]
MPKLSLSTIGIVIVLVAVVGGVYFYFTGGFSQLGQEQEQQKEETTFVPEVRSVAGKVTSVNVAENSFVLLQVKEERSFTVKLGEETEFIRLVFPFDLNNPPADVTFTPEREVVTIEDLKENEQVFVRSNSPIKIGQEITNPLEIQILP